MKARNMPRCSFCRRLAAPYKDGAVRGLRVVCKRHKNKKINWVWYYAPVVIAE